MNAPDPLAPDARLDGPNGFVQPIATLRREGDGITILDQTRLPHDCATLQLTTLAAVAHAITTMQVRGAPLIGATAAFGVAIALHADGEAGDAALATALDTLAATRPTAVNLHWALRRMQARLAALPASARTAAAWAEAEAIRAEDAATCAAIGRHGLEMLQALAQRRTGPLRIMTHCNAGWVATLGAGTALAPIYAAHASGLPVHVWVSETRPRNQGLLTAWELRQAGVPHSVIADNAAGILLARGEVDLVITGADRIAVNGDTANKVGTYLKALAATDNRVPFYIAAPRSTIDFACAGGHAIPIEDRGPAELHWLAGLDDDGTPARLRQLPADAAAANPAFDVTPARLIDGIITEFGLFAPAHIATLAPATPHG